jgi:hypothetical protein
MFSKPIFTTYYIANPLLAGPSLAKGIGYVEDSKAMDHDVGRKLLPFVSDDRTPGQQICTLKGDLASSFILRSTIGTVHYHNTIRAIFMHNI